MFQNNFRKRILFVFVFFACNISNAVHAEVISCDNAKLKVDGIFGEQTDGSHCPTVAMSQPPRQLETQEGTYCRECGYRLDAQKHCGNSYCPFGPEEPKIIREKPMPTPRRLANPNVQCTPDDWYICKEENTGDDLEYKALDFGWKFMAALAVAGSVFGIAAIPLLASGVLNIHPAFAALGFIVSLVGLALAYPLKEARNMYSWELSAKQRARAKKRYEERYGEPYDSDRY